MKGYAQLISVASIGWQPMFESHAHGVNHVVMHIF